MLNGHSGDASVHDMHVRTEMHGPFKGRGSFTYPVQAVDCRRMSTTLICVQLL